MLSTSSIRCSPNSDRPDAPRRHRSPESPSSASLLTVWCATRNSARVRCRALLSQVAPAPASQAFTLPEVMWLAEDFEGVVVGHLNVDVAVVARRPSSPCRLWRVTPPRTPPPSWGRGVLGRRAARRATESGSGTARPASSASTSLRSQAAGIRFPMSRLTFPGTNETHSSSPQTQRRRRERARRPVAAN